MLSGTMVARHSLVNSLQDGAVFPEAGVQCIEWQRFSA
jgi:hypothetical protein